MKVFVAGASGTIGRPLVRALLAAGHHVTALTRSSTAAAELSARGADIAIADALNHDALVAAVTAARPTHVIHQLTALPKHGPRSLADIEPTNRLRIEGTRNLLDAAIAAGATRFIAGSFAILAPRETGAATPPTAAAAAVLSMETQVLDATRRGVVEGVILRYGLFYAAEAPSTIALVDMVRRRRLPAIRHDAGQLPLIHVDDAVAATVRALDSAPAGSTYDIVDDRAVSFSELVETLAAYTGSPAPYRVPAWLPKLLSPYMARMTAVRLPLSNAWAKADLGWTPAYPTIREGLSALRQRAA